MEDVDENANNGIDEEEFIGNVPSPLLSATQLNKRLRSKVWDVFTPTFVDGKVARAECMLCHRVFNCCSTNGTSSLLRHQATCRSRTPKRPRHQELTPLPCIQNILVASGTDPKQKKLSFLPSNQKKCLSTADASPEQKQLALPDTYTDTKTKNQEVDQNGSHEELVVPEEIVASLIVSTENNKCHAEIPSPGQEPIDTSQKNQKVDQNCSSQEFVKILLMHGQSPSMMNEDRFKKLVTWLNPMVNIPSPYDLIGNTWCLFAQEKSKLKEKIAALHSWVCLSAYMWHYDLVSAFLCLTVHYIDDEWEKQQKIIKFCPVDPTCNSNELSEIIIRAIAEWGLDGKVFCILLDDAFVDDSVASNVKARLQECNRLSVNRSLFVVRYATHLLDRVMQLGLDELRKFMEKSSKCSKYTMGLTSSVVHYPNPRYASSGQYWIRGEKICDILGHFHMDVDSMHSYCSPTDLFEKLWDVKNKIRDKIDSHSKRASSEKDEGFLNVLQKMEQKIKEWWELCFFHLCMPMVMDPKYRLGRIKSRVRSVDFKRYRKEIKHYIHYVHDALVNLFYEYSYQVDDPNCTSGSKTSEGTAGDMLGKYYRETEYPCGNRPLTELDQYLQDPCLTTGESSVLQWWKENNQTYPRIARMARDILALPCCTDRKVATATARIAMSQFGKNILIEELVCAQDWLKPAGTTAME